jgi:putative transposase
MARSMRIQFPGAYYHIISRGNNRQSIFFDDFDRLLFLRILGRTQRSYSWKCFAYVLMNNHYHLFIQISKCNLSEGMRDINGIYTQKINKRHKRIGHIFQGRYKSILVDSDSYFTELTRYILLNPIRAGIATQVDTWPWSSYHNMFNNKFPYLKIETHSILENFSLNSHEAHRIFLEFLNDGITKSTSLPLPTGNILGPKDFITKLNIKTCQVPDPKEVPGTV